MTALSDSVYQIGIYNDYFLIGSGTVPDYTLCNWYGPKRIEVWEGITEIGTACISGVELLTTVTLPVSLQVIGDGSFYRNDLLEHVYYAGTREQWAMVSASESVKASLESVLVCADEEGYLPGITTPVFKRNTRGYS